jgi:hypothetical protein
LAPHQSLSSKNHNYVKLRVIAAKPKGHVHDS